MKSILKMIGVGALLVIIFLALTAGCGQKTPQTSGAVPASTQAAQEIQVLVPCGQMGPFYEIKPLFEKANPGVKINETTENIAVLTRKIMDGVEHPEVFMSMGDREVSMIEAKGRVMPGTRVAYAPNSICLIVPTANPAGVKQLKDVASPAVKSFAVVHPDNSSAGYHAREALEKIGVWKKVAQKTTIPDQPELVAQIVAKGDAQAGIGYWPCMTETHTPGAGPAPRKKVKVAEIIPQKLYTPFSCTAVVVEGAKNPEAGKKFIAFLQTPEAQAIFAKWNFVSPEKQPAAK